MSNQTIKILFNLVWLLTLIACAPAIQQKDPLNDPQYDLVPQELDAEVNDLKIHYVLVDEVLERKRAIPFRYTYENNVCTTRIDIGYRAFRTAVYLSVGYCLYLQQYGQPTNTNFYHRVAGAWLDEYTKVCGYLLAPLGLPMNDGKCASIPTLKQALSAHQLY